MVRVFHRNRMVYLDVYLFDGQETDRVAKIVVVESFKAHKYNSETMKKTEG